MPNTKPANVIIAARADQDVIEVPQAHWATVLVSVRLFMVIKVNARDVALLYVGFNAHFISSA